MTHESPTPLPESVPPKHSFGNFLGTHRREVIAVLLAFIFGLALRVQFYPSQGFDREYDGFQGAFFGFAAINYERIGFEPTGGYPVINLDTHVDQPDTWYIYGNHSPVLALWEWASLKAFGPPGWEDAWREDRAPSGLGTDHQFEFALRLPMFIISLLSLLALWWAVRIEGGKRAALFALLLYAAAPLAALQAGLVNYEPGTILFVLLCLGFFAKLRQRDRAALALGETPKCFTRELFAACFFLAVGASQTYAPLLFALPLCLAALMWRRRVLNLKCGLATATSLGLAGLLPVLLHGAHFRRALGGAQEPTHLSDRVRVLLEPLTSGEIPLTSWLATQYKHLSNYGGEGLVTFAGLGLLFGLFIMLARREGKSLLPNPAMVPLLLFLGGFVVLLGFYKHTSEDPPQSPFVLFVLPSLAALGGLGFVEMGDAVGRTFARGGRAHGGSILTAILLALTLYGGYVSSTQMWERWRGEEPQSTMPEVIGSQLGELLPPGAVGLYPASLGFNIATSFYAWRTLLPVKPDIESVRSAVAILTLNGQAASPRYILLPDNPPPAAQAETAALEAFLQKMAPEVAARAPLHAHGWRAWHLGAKD